MNNPVLQAIADRRSIRGYAAERITEEQLRTLLTAAQQAPSARNSQPWHFSVVQDRAILDEFARDYVALAGGDPAKAEVRDGYNLFFRAPTVIFISTPVEAPTRYSQIDCGIAAQTIALAAHSIGLGTVILGRPMDVFLSPKGPAYEKAFKFPEGHKFAIAVAVGRPTLSKDAHPIREGLVSRI
ncbi:MAG: nitroreductase family protein [Clostridiales bacterium]|nr:nitroreductase family protein [Clostridiales bacterium]